jgi:fatty acid desaturase
MSDQSRRPPARPSDLLDPVQAKPAARGSWTDYLVLFMRIMALVSLAKGLYHWGQVCGIDALPDQTFEMRGLPWQSATVFFAVIDLVAAVGLWLAAAWGAVVWLTSIVSMVVVEAFFPNIYGGSAFIVLTEMGLLCVYLGLAIAAARERPA